MKSIRTLAMGLALCLYWASHSFWPSVASAEETSAPTAVEAGKKISIEYTLTLGDGVEFESNIGGKALSFEHGTGQIIEGLDAAMIGMKVGERKTVTIEPKQGYGLVDLEAFMEVPLLALPEANRHVGGKVVAHDPELGDKVFRVDRINQDKAVLDGNHPLAGKTLTFDFTILAVE